MRQIHIISEEGLVSQAGTIGFGEVREVFQAHDGARAITHDNKVVRIAGNVVTVSF